MDIIENIVGFRHGLYSDINGQMKIFFNVRAILYEHCNTVESIVVPGVINVFFSSRYCAC